MFDLRKKSVYPNEYFSARACCGMTLFDFEKAIGLGSTFFDGLTLQTV